MAAAKTFWASFFDGFTGDGIFGDLQIPGTPTRLFKEEPSEVALKAATQGPISSEIGRRIAEQHVSVVGVSGEPVRYFAGAEQVALPELEPVAVEAVHVDVNGEIVNIARDRVKGWVILSAPTMHAAEAAKFRTR